MEMKFTQRLFIYLFLSLWISSISFAYDGLDLYDCVISDKDRFSSKGVKLTSIRNILAQDRANYHRFKKRDAYDSEDGTFVTTVKRQLWQTAKIIIDPKLKERIIWGGDVEIKIFILTEDLIEVREGLLDPNVG